MRVILATLIIMTILMGCATESNISPTLLSPARSGFDLNPPILVAVFDGRATQEPKDAAKTLQTDLGRLYVKGIEWEDYFSKTPPGRIAVHIRIVTLGASFGSRLISSIAFASAIGSAQASATGPWGPVVSNVTSEKSVFAGSFSGEGWWNGAAWIDLEVQDHRGTKQINFTLPIAAEHRESNVWGYSSGDKAARVAWDRVAVQLTRALDAIARTVRDQQS
jgi:hypothetical protein